MRGCLVCAWSFEPNGRRNPCSITMLQLFGIDFSVSKRWLWLPLWNGPVILLNLRICRRFRVLSNLRNPSSDLQGPGCVAGNVMGSG